MIRPFSSLAGQSGPDIRAASAEDGVGVGAIARDLSALNLHNQLGARAYFQHRLFDPRSRIPIRGLSPRQRAGDPPALVAAHSGSLPAALRNKLVFNRLFGGQGSPVAPVFGVYDPRIGSTVDGEELRNAADLRRWISRAPVDGFLFKALYGIEGYQALALSAARSKILQASLLSRAIATMRIAWRSLPETPGSWSVTGHWHLDSHLIEERIRPHPVMAQLVGPRFAAAGWRPSSAGTGTRRFSVPCTRSSRNRWAWTT